MTKDYKYRTSRKEYCQKNRNTDLAVATRSGAKARISIADKKERLVE
ncbi:MAG: hypothetical protein ACRER2_14995 [Methylococcales bacterium]